MSYLYGLDPAEQNRALDNANTHGADLSQVGPGAFDGSLEGVATGLFSGLIAKPALLVGDAATNAAVPLAEQFDKVFNTGTAEYLRAEQQKNVTMLEQLKERQATYGRVGQLVTGFADVAPQAVAGFALGGPAGAAALTGTVQGYADTRLSMEEGIDPATAMGKGAITGVANAVGVVVPMAKVGASLATNLAIGAGVNTAMGMASRGATAALLEHNGYTEQAKQYQWLDKEALITDAILGAAFGGLGHYMHGKFEPRAEQVDAALMSNEKLHMEMDTAPGVPKTPEARDAHVEAQMRATEQMMRGESVDVADIARRVDALEDPALTQRMTIQDEAMRAEYPKEVIEPPKEVVPRETVVEKQRGAAEPAAQPEAGKPASETARGVPAETPPKPHDGTPESMARAGDARPIETSRAQQILDTKPDLMALNDAGEPVRAADLLKAADIEVEAAKRDSVLHDVAVACFLRG